MNDYRNFYGIFIKVKKKQILKKDRYYICKCGETVYGTTCKKCGKCRKIRSRYYLLGACRDMEDMYFEGYSLEDRLWWMDSLDTSMYKYYTMSDEFSYLGLNRTNTDYKASNFLVEISEIEKYKDMLNDEEVLGIISTLKENGWEATAYVGAGNYKY